MKKSYYWNLELQELRRAVHDLDVRLARMQKHLLIKPRENGNDGERHLATELDELGED